MSNISLVDANQYARMTLAQHGASDVKLCWTNTKQRFGCFRPWRNQIDISKRTLVNFHLFQEILLHEIAHALDFKEGGVPLCSTGRRTNWHGRNWKKWCKKIGLTKPRRLIPLVKVLSPQEYSQFFR